MPPPPSFYFDEIVHLGVIGGGFLRTPFIHATKDIPEGYNHQQDCSPLTAEVIHIPTSLRRSTLTEPRPPFRRVVLTSDLMKRISSDKAVQFNQEAAGIVFNFHEDANHNLAHAFCLPETQVAGEQAFVLDNLYPGFHLDKTMLVNELGFPDNLKNSRAPSGFLTFISRFWQGQRHVDESILTRHTIPLQLDLDFNMFWCGQTPFSPVETEVTVPIWGAIGNVKVWDARLGIESYQESLNDSPYVGSPIDGNGGRMIVINSLGGPVLKILSTLQPLESIPIVLQDDSGQTFTRQVVVHDTFPSPLFVSIPAARLDTPYSFTLPPDNNDTRITDMRLPTGMLYDFNTNILSGTPTEYGGQFFIKAEYKHPTTGYEARYFILPVNRPPRLIYTFPECTMGNDKSTGEYYAMQFMPFGLALHYNGWSYEHRRARTGPNAVPHIRAVPFAYGHANRRGAADAEETWRLASAQTLASQGT